MSTAGTPVLHDAPLRASIRRVSHSLTRAGHENRQGRLERARDQLAAIEVALERVRDGRYGLCDRCGQPIGDDRLAARPAALTCIRCAVLFGPQRERGARPSITRRPVERFAGHQPPAAETSADLSALTPCELEVLGLIARGLSNAELAAELTLSEATVKTHVARILTKLQLRDRVQAVVLAYETGLVSAGQGHGPGGISR
jgi:ATP/maltotriose-dependent transcriptional regulator MalT